MSLRNNNDQAALNYSPKGMRNTSPNTIDPPVVGVEPVRPRGKMTMYWRSRHVKRGLADSVSAQIPAASGALAEVPE